MYFAFSFWGICFVFIPFSISLFQLPGRTDNEIKNYWNTRIKRMQRAGLPIYPDEIYQRVFNGHQESLNVDTLSNESSQHDDLSQTENFDIPDVEFRKFKLRRDISCEPSIFDMPQNSMPEQSSDQSHGHNILLPMMHPSKRLRGPDMIYDSLDNCISSVVPVFDPYGNDACDNITDHPRFSSPCDPMFNTGDQFHGDNLTGSHAASNGNNSSSSEPISGPMKLELPSLQYLETQQGSWGTPASPLPSFESVDTLIQSPPIEPIQSGHVSPQCSGLLESIIYNFKGSNVDSLQEKTDNCVRSEAVKSSIFNTIRTEWDEQGEPSSASVLSDYTPISMCSVDGPHSVETTQG